MKELTKERIKVLSNSLKTRKIIVFGVGSGGLICLEILKYYRLKVNYFIDNNKTINGTLFTKYCNRKSRTPYKRKFK